MLISKMYHCGKNISCRDIAAFGWYMILYDNILTHFRETWKMGDHPARFWAGGWSGTTFWM